jgi:hypothetical protein
VHPDGRPLAVWTNVHDNGRVANLQELACPSTMKGAQRRPRVESRLLLLDAIPARGERLFELACERDLEGIVAKHRDAPSSQDPTLTSWCKNKNPDYSQAVSRHGCLLVNCNVIDGGTTNSHSRTQSSEGADVEWWRGSSRGRGWLRHARTHCRSATDRTAGAIDHETRLASVTLPSRLPACDPS